MNSHDEIHNESHGHPGAGEYVKVALFLAVVTGLEVGLYYITQLSDIVLTALLAVLMVIKFAIVGLWFMHLKFDSPIFKHLFVAGIVLAIAIYSVVLIHTTANVSIIPGV